MKPNELARGIAVAIVGLILLASAAYATAVEDSALCTTTSTWCHE